MTAEIVVPDRGVQGVIIAQGGSIGGWSLYVRDGRLRYCREDGALVAENYPVPNAFTGEVKWVELDVGDAAVDADYRLDPDELLRVAMARQ